MTAARTDATPAVAGTVWIVRHAATDWTGRRWCGRSDPDLNEVGRDQARRLAAELATELGETELRTTAIVLTSPLRRATQTADEIARSLAATVRIEDALAEVDFGAADGLTWDDVEEREPALAAALLAGLHPDWPGGETAAAVAHRASLAAEVITGIVARGPLVVVSHGGLLQALGALIRGGQALDGLSPGAFVPTTWRRAS